ncbi:Cation/multidrug efflux pump [Marinobacter sp. ELB17]|nr:Cation/multidrug efflux pump [Marinobacter sp. ELB17]
MTLKVPGVIENVEDVMSIPVKVDGDTVITFGDVAMLQRSYKDPQGFARINGEPALVLEVSKRSGANIIATSAQVRALIVVAQERLPDELDIRYIMDQSGEVQDLLNNVLTAIVLVTILMTGTPGVPPTLFWRIFASAPQTFRVWS